MKNSTKNLKGRLLIQSFLLRFALFGAGWMVLVGGQKLSDIGFVILFVAATTVFSMYTIPPGQWLLRLPGVVRFVPFFLITALRGGWDVAKRVFFRTVPINPGFITIEHDRNPQKTLVLALVISLLPGTASTDITGENIVVHVLDKKLPVTEEIRELQIRIDAMFVEPGR